MLNVHLGRIIHMNEGNQDSKWFRDYTDEGQDETQIEEYDITSSPNDFNITTLYSFIESGAVKIPGFQRNFVWDISRASKLIESILLGLPIPQIFLYEKNRNEFLVLDGQQRLMSIYYFVTKRFPKKDKRVEIRHVFDEQGSIPESILNDDSYFQTFNLRLPAKLPNRQNRFHGLNYSTLGDYKPQFDLRTIRNVIVKQTSPDDGSHSSMFELFNRLNTGGMNLRPQEIRTSMYNSEFYRTLHEINNMDAWRNFIGSGEPDIHMKDIEILLRGFAFLIDENNYVPSMVKFLNQFSSKSMKNNQEQNIYLKKLFISFLDACSDLPSSIFKKNNRFNFALYEAAFVATCRKAFEERRFLNNKVDSKEVEDLEIDESFDSTIKSNTTSKQNVIKRLDRAREIITTL